jgi:hypothetical protein
VAGAAGAPVTPKGTLPLFSATHESPATAGRRESTRKSQTLAPLPFVSISVRSWLNFFERVRVFKPFLQRQPKFWQGTDDGPEVTPRAF